MLVHSSKICHKNQPQRYLSVRIQPSPSAAYDSSARALDTLGEVGVTWTPPSWRHAPSLPASLPVVWWEDITVTRPGRQWRLLEWVTRTTFSVPLTDTVRKAANSALRRSRSLGLVLPTDRAPSLLVTLPTDRTPPMLVTLPTGWAPPLLVTPAFKPNPTMLVILAYRPNPAPVSHPCLQTEPPPLLVTPAYRPSPAPC